MEGKKKKNVCGSGRKVSKTDRFLFRHNAIKHTTPHACMKPLPHATFNHTGPLTGQNTRAGPCKGLVHVAQVGSVSLPGNENMAAVKTYADVHTYTRRMDAYNHTHTVAHMHMHTQLCLEPRISSPGVK